MEAPKFTCPINTCEYSCLTLNELANHRLENHSTLGISVEVDRNHTRTIQQSRARINDSINSMTTIEIAQYLAKLDTITWNEIMYRAYTIKAVEYWH